MNLKPSLKKIIISLIGMIILGFSWGIFYSKIFCHSHICLAMVAFCDYHDMFSCCSGNCISQLTHITQLGTIFLPSFFIIYLSYSLFQNKKEKKFIQLFLSILIILILITDLTILSNYFENKDDHIKLAQESTRAKELNSLFEISIILWDSIQYSFSSYPPPTT